jgi:hypothetical protein
MAGREGASQSIALVIAPFGGPPYVDEVFAAIGRVCSQFKLRAVRVGADPAGGLPITDRIIENILGADLVIAELSSPDPKVFWELGFAYGARDVETVIHVARTGTSLPFEIVGFDPILYRDRTELEDKLREKIGRHCSKSGRVPSGARWNAEGPPDYHILAAPEAWRRRHRFVEPLEEGVPLADLPNGIYGYTVPWLLSSNPDGVVGGTGVDKISLGEQGGTAVLEIHKTAEGEIYFMACARRADEENFRDQSLRKRPFKATVAFEPVQEFILSVAIPVARVVVYTDRSVRLYGYIADLELV